MTTKAVRLATLAAIRAAFNAAAQSSNAAAAAISAEHTTELNPVTTAFNAVGNALVAAAPAILAAIDAANALPDPTPVPSPTTGIVVAFGSLTAQLAPFETAPNSTIYRAAIDDHLVAWAEVRSGDRMVWLEASCDLYKPNPARRDGLATVTFDGAVVFSQAVSVLHHTRAVLVKPKAQTSFDWRTLIDSKSAPPYGFRSPANKPALLPYKVPSGNPTGGPFGGPAEGGLGSLPYDMGDPGFAWYIGLLPMPDALYATSGTSLDMVLDCAMAGGSYPVHFRDEKTNKPFLPSVYPNVWLQDATGDANQAPTPGDGINGRPDAAHMPAFGFVAYLATGWRYFQEECQFWALWAFGWPSYRERDGASGTLTQQPRGQAWTLRQWAQAAKISDEPLRSEFIRLIEGGLAQKRAMCVDGTITSGVFSHYHNALGVLGHYNGSGIAGDPYGGKTPGQGWQDSLFMHNFFVQALGYVSELGLPLSAKGQADLVAVRDFAYKHAVAQGWSPKHIGVYTRPYGIIGDPPNVYPEPYFTDYSAAWQQVQFKVAPFDASPSGPLVNYDGTEVIGGIPNSYVANHVPGLAYAVRHNAPGAQAAWDTLIQSSTWRRDSSLFNDTPIFGITPTGSVPPVPTPDPVPVPIPVPAPSGDATMLDPGVVPNWLAGKPVGIAFDIAGSELASCPGILNAQNKVNAYNGSGLRTRGSVLFMGPNGGHGDGWQNDIPALTLGAQAPAWKIISPSSALSDVQDAAYFKDGKPNPGHTYRYLQFLNGRDILAVACQSATTPAGGTYPNFNAFDYKTGKWLRFADNPIPDVDGGCVTLPNDDIVVAAKYWAKRWLSAEDRWADYISSDYEIGTLPLSYDTKRNEVVRAPNGTYGNMWAWGASAKRNPADARTIPVSRLDAFAPAGTAGAQMIYDPDIDRHVYWCGLRLWLIHPDTGAVEDTGVTLPQTRSYNRLQRLPELKCYVFLHAWDKPITAFRLA